MYFNKTVLTLMAISLYLIPRAELAEQLKEGTSEVEQQSEDAKSLDQGQSDNEVIIIQKDNELKGIIEGTEKSGQSCVIYFVENTDNYDEMFREFARQHLTTKFVKIDVFKLYNDIKPEEERIKLEIYFYKFGKYTGHVSSEDKEFIESQIRTLERMTNDNNSTDDEDEDSSELMIEYSDGVYTTDNKAGLDHLYTNAIIDGKFIFTYVVINTEKYDQMFKELAVKHDKTRFIRIDSTKFRYTDNVFNMDVQPVMVFQRLEAVTNGFVSENKDEIDAKLDFYENMSQSEFEDYVKSQIKERNQTGVKEDHPEDSGEGSEDDNDKH